MYRMSLFEKSSFIGGFFVITNKMYYSVVEKSVLATIIYYDILDIALTEGDIRGTLIRLNNGDISRQDISEALENLQTQNVIIQLHDRYALKCREYLVPLREGRVRIAHKKLKLLAHIVAWLRYVPYLETIFASGSLALLNTSELSDLDVLIVVRQGRIWTARFFITALCELLRVRRTKFHIRAPDAICLNHYVTDTNLSVPYHSLFNAQTYINLIPLYIRGAITKEYFLKENSWIGNYVANPEYSYNARPLLQNNRIAHAIATLFASVLDAFIGERIEQWLKKYQQRRIFRTDGSIEEGSDISDSALSFHPDSPEQEIEQLFQLGLKEYDISGVHFKSH